MKKPLVIYPFLFAVFPILFLFAHNIALTPTDQIITPLAITVLFTLLLFSLLSFVFKDREKAGLIVTLFLLLFFSFGHFFNVIKDFYFLIRNSIINPRGVLFLWNSLLFISGINFCVRTRKNLNNLTRFLNAVAVFLVVISLINIGGYKLKTKASWKDNRGIENREANLMNLEKKPAMLPDIYYIILDGYAGADILKEIYEYDNTEFINYLVKKGFYVANESRSNYCQTILSLASSLNFKHLNYLAADVGFESDNRQPLTIMIKDNLVFRILKRYGYTTVAFDASGGWYPVEIKDTDIFYKTPGWSMSAFYNELISTTPLPFILKEKRGPVAKQYDFHRKKILYAFDRLGDVPKEKEPLFVFVHILAPHQPFVFGENGEPIISDTRRFTIWDPTQVKRNKDEYIESYKKQLSFINKKVKIVIDKMLSNSSRPLIIILQADHGPSSRLDPEDPDNTDFRERMSILNAYYFPDNNYKQLYDEITPVNTFRIIFNQYLETDYDLLRDESYFSTWSKPYKFTNVIDSTIN